jgi:hypothetical protein
MRKLSNKEALLLKMLAGVAVVCALGIMLVLTAPQVSTLQDQIGKFEQGIGNAKSLEVNEKELGVYYETLKKEIQKEKQSFYTADERDLTVLGIRMLSLIRKNGLTYNRLNKVDAKDGNYIEIGLSGNIVNVLRFFKEIYSQPKYLNVNFVTLNNTRGLVKTTIRMNYGTVAEIPH